MDEKWSNHLQASAGSVPQQRDDDLTITAYVVQGIVLCLVTLLMTLRLLSKRFVPRAIDPQDVGCAAAYILMITYCILGVIYVRNCGGYHYKDMKADKIVLLLKIIWVQSLVYTVLVFSIKILLLSILLRLFGAQKRVIVFIKIFLCLLVTYYLVATVLRICICSPPSAFWRIPRGKCLNIFANSIADSVISVVTDGAILALPLFLARSSPMSKMRNVRVASILVVGGLITLTNVYRTVLLFKEGRSVDFTEVSIKLFLAGNIETGIGFICTCLPPVIVWISKRLGDRSSRRDKNNDHEMGSHGHPYSRQRTHSEVHDPFPVPPRSGSDDDKDFLILNAQESASPSTLDTPLPPSTPEADAGIREFMGGRAITKTMTEARKRRFKRVLHLFT